jgi:hypothetical protein
MKKFLCFAFCLLSGVHTLFSQVKVQNDTISKEVTDAGNNSRSNTSQKAKDTRPIIKRLSLDMTTSFWINPSNIYFEFSPSIIYNFPKTYAVGAGPVYIYNKEISHNTGLNGWGGRVYGRANFTRWLYGYTEYQGIQNQYISLIDDITGKVTRDTEFVSSFFVSLGINIRIGRRHGISLQALYDVLYDNETSPYYAPVIYRLGFGF